VLVSHLDWIAGNPTDNLRRLGLYAVAIFFGLSGFLLTDSILRGGANSNFIRNRVLRIFPGLIGVLVLTSLFFAPLYHIIETREFEYIFSQDNFLYIFRNMTTYILQSDINSSLEDSNVPNWNPPLWTLWYELVCYFLLFILIRTLGTRYISIINIFLPTFIAIYLLRGFLIIHIPSRINMVIYYASFFFLGSFLYIKKVHEKINLFIVLIFASLLSFLIPRNSDTVFFDNRDFVLGLFLVPLSIFLSFNPKVTIKLRNDYSFGIYIYSAPISQLLILKFDAMRQNWLIYASCTLGVTLIFSWLSWNLIEKPALKLKNVKFFH
jgi:peptidoglycan/LPS O-acetylase OafA/YrhL